MLDILFNRTSGRRCDGISRRDALRVGTLAPLGLSLTDYLSLSSAQAAGAGKARARSVLLVYLGGGLSHHDSFDLKPDAPEEIRGKYKPIASALPDVLVGELLPRTALVMDKLTLVRSGAHNNDHHETATNWVLSGRFGSPFGDHPAIGAVVAHESGFSGKLPPYVAVPRNPSFTWELGKSAYLGGRYESFKTGDPNAENFEVRDLTVAGSLATPSGTRRQSLLAALDDLSTRVRGNDQLATYDEFQGRAAAMILSKEAQEAFDIRQEEARVRDAYGRNTFGQSCLLARRLVERGVRFATVNYGGWDHHAKIFENLDRKLPEFDVGFSALLADMDERGLLEETLVAVFGEFGRTPKINKDAGRDHWGPAASLLFAGAGVRRGHVIGATDKQGAAVTTRPVRPADVAFTILDALGIDPRKQLRTPDGRPIEILDEGAIIGELFA
jgi:hypothetical protein